MRHSQVPENKQADSSMHSLQVPALHEEDDIHQACMHTQNSTVPLQAASETHSRSQILMEDCFQRLPIKHSNSSPASSHSLQVPDLDGGLGGGAQPVAVGGEAQGVDDVAGVQGVQALALGQVPQHGHAVLGWETRVGGWQGAGCGWVNRRGAGCARQKGGVSREAGARGSEQMGSERGRGEVRPWPCHWRRMGPARDPRDDHDENPTQTRRNNQLRLTLPPEAHREPSGETVTVLT